MRHTFETSRETIKVINGHARELAEEAGTSDKYVYGILAGTQTDWFAVFDHYYAAAVRAGLDVSHWDNRLCVIRSRYKSGERLCRHQETGKLGKETADVADAVLTGKPLLQQLAEVTEAESQIGRTKQAIIDAINKEKDKTVEPRTFARAVVSVRNGAK